MKSILSLVPLAAVLVLSGCATPFPHADLALKDAFGVSLDEPRGGTLAVDKFGLSGAMFVTDWARPEDAPSQEVRGFYYPGVGPFESKTSWAVQEWADRKTGRIDLLFARLDLDLDKLDPTTESESVIRNGHRIYTAFRNLMGEPSSIRFRGTDGAFVTSVPKTGTWEKNYLWVKGPQAVRLGLTYGDGGEGRTGRIAVEIQRLDALDEATRRKVLADWGVN